MGKNFYNLPSPWNPGYALPANVEAEGLRRAALVTGWQPRGTFEPAPAARNGYVLPRYIRPVFDGSTARTTAWLPRGTYTGGRITPGATSPNDPITKYGQKAATRLVALVQKVPSSHRGAAMKVVLDKIDPTLWRRAGAHAATFRAKGVAADKALTQGLAKAMSQGVLSELVETGRRGQPKRKSQVGMGCFGCAAPLGEVLQDLGAVGKSAGPGTTKTAGGVTTVDHRGQPAPTFHAPSTTHDTGDKVQIGPFVLGAQGQRIRVHDPSVIPADWKQLLQDEAKRLLQVDPDKTHVHLAHEFGLDYWFGLGPAQEIGAQYFNGSTPIFKSTNPITGKDMGVYMNATPTYFEVWYKDVVNKPSTWDKIKRVVAKIVHGISEGAKAAANFAGDALKEVAKLACDMVNDGGTAGAAGLAAGPAGAVGVGVAQGLCPDTPPPPPPAMVAASSSSSGLVLPLAIGGAALAAFFLLK